MLAAYDQYRIRSMVFEYAAECSSFTPGGLEMEYLDDAGDMLQTESGFTALRDADSRADAVECQWWECCETRLTFPQQKWYYTGGTDTPGLTLPGLVDLQTMLSEPDSVGSPAIYGFLRMHFEIETRAPGVPGSIPQEYYSAGTSLVFTNAVFAVNTPVRVTPTLSVLTANLTRMGVVYWGQIIAGEDPGGATPQQWREWQPGEDGDVEGDLLTMGPGGDSNLFWRVLYVGGVEYLCFFPTFNDAISADTYQSGSRFFLASATIASPPVDGVRTFYLQNVQGAEVNGERANV